MLKRCTPMFASTMIAALLCIWLIICFKVLVNVSVRQTFLQYSVFPLVYDLSFFDIISSTWRNMPMYIVSICLKYSSGHTCTCICVRVAQYWNLRPVGNLICQATSWHYKGINKNILYTYNLFIPVLILYIVYLRRYISFSMLNKTHVCVSF